MLCHKDFFIALPHPLHATLFESLGDENRPHPENWIDKKGPGLLGPTKADWGQGYTNARPLTGAATKNTAKVTFR